MDKLSALQNMISSEGLQAPLSDFVLNFILAAVFAHILGILYVRFGRSLSNRSGFSKNFVLIAVTTMLIISIVKSSLALSLGLVGALSIVRFRAAIKEPEELAFLFFNIGIGLGFGAGQKKITIVAFLLTAIFLISGRLVRKPHERENMYLTVVSEDSSEKKLHSIVELMENNSSALKLKRIDKTETTLEAFFMVEYSGYEQLRESIAELQKLDHTMGITFLGDAGIL